MKDPTNKAILATTIILVSIIVLVLVGCVAVPETDISYTPGTAGKPPSVRIKAPKDVDIQGFELVRDGTGQATLKIKSYRARMSPAVIEAQAAREVDIINSVGNAVSQAGQAAIQAYTSGGGSMIGGSSPIGTTRPIGVNTNLPPIR